MKKTNIDERQCCQQKTVLEFDDKSMKMVTMMIMLMTYGMENVCTTR